MILLSQEFKVKLIDNDFEYETGRHCDGMQLSTEPSYIVGC